MLTKSTLKRVLARTPRNAECYVVIGGVAYSLNGVVASQVFPYGADAPNRLWFVAGPRADHEPPAEVHHPRTWLNRSHNKEPKA